MKKLKKMLILSSLMALGATSLIISENINAVNTAQLKRSSSVPDLHALADISTWQPMSLEDYLRQEVHYATKIGEKINQGSGPWNDHVIDSVKNVTPKLKELMEKLGVRDDGDDGRGNHIFTIDLSINNMIKVASEKLAQVSEQEFDWTRFSGKSDGLGLTLGELKFLITNEGSPLKSLITEINHPDPQKDHYQSPLNEEERNLFTDLLLNQIFDLQNLSDEEATKFRAVLCNQILVNNTGCKRMFAMLIASVLNSNPTTALESSQRLQKVLIENAKESCYLFDEKKIDVDFSKDDLLDSAIFHESTHAYLNMISRSFNNTNWWEFTCGRELKFISWSIFSSNIPYLVKLFYPMLTKENLEKLASTDSRKETLSESDIFAGYKFGIGNIIKNLRLDRSQSISAQIKNLLITNPVTEILYSNFLEMIAMIGFVPFKYGDHLYLVNDQQNEDTYINRKAALVGGENPDQIRDASQHELASGVCRFHKMNEYPYPIESLKEGLPFYQLEAPARGTADSNPSYILRHKKYLDSKCSDFSKAVKSAQDACADQLS